MPLCYPKDYIYQFWVFSQLLKTIKIGGSFIDLDWSQWWSWWRRGISTICMPLYYPKDYIYQFWAFSQHPKIIKIGGSFIYLDWSQWWSWWRMRYFHYLYAFILPQGLYIPLLSLLIWSKDHQDKRVLYLSWLGSKMFFWLLGLRCAMANEPRPNF